MDKEFTHAGGKFRDRSRADAMFEEPQKTIQAESPKVPRHFTGTDTKEFYAWAAAYVDQRLQEVVPQARCDAYVDV